MFSLAGSHNLALVTVLWLFLLPSAVPWLPAAWEGS